MISTADFRNGLVIILDNVLFEIVEFQHVKPGKGNQFTRTKLRNLLTGNNLERTFKSGERFEIPDVETREMTALYKEGSAYLFMDKASYDQISVEEEDVGDAKYFLIENLEVQVSFYNGNPSTWTYQSPWF